MVRTRRALFALTTVTLVVSACAGAKPQADLEPRYVAVHNTLVAMGLAETGPIQSASLAEGRDAKLKLDLAAGCTTVVVLGGAGVKDIHAEISDAKGNPVAKDTGSGPEAAVRACVENAGPYELAVKMQRGAGDFLMATWSGGAGQNNSAAPLLVPLAREAEHAPGTCEAPVAIGAGTIRGTTAHGESEQTGSCGGAEAKEVVYRLDLASREHVVIDLEPAGGNYDGILYLRQGECADADSEIACNDDLKSSTRSGQKPSRVDEVLDAGTYYVIADGYNSSEGPFKLVTTIEDIPSLAEVCQRARAVGAVQMSGGTQGSFDHANAKCADGAKGPDTVYKLEVAQKERVRLTEHSDDYSPVIHVRSTCTDDSTELGCSDSSVEDKDAAFVGLLESGSYGVFADATEADADGHFTLDFESSPEGGAGTQGDACGDAVLLPTASKVIDGDTFTAKDDTSGSCTATGGADVVYRLELPRKLRVSASFAAQEGDHVMSLQKSCGDKSTEISCADSIDETLAAGTYFLSVDGKTKSDFGKFKLDYRVRDMSLQEAACRNAPSISPGQTVSGTTKNAAHKFSTSCGGIESGQTSPDAVYRITVAKRTHAVLTLLTPQHEGVLSLRKACVDPAHAVGLHGIEVACNVHTETEHQARVNATLEPGTYYAVVDGHLAGQSGPFKLTYQATAN